MTLTARQRLKFRGVVLQMIAAASAYKTYARGWKERGPADPFKKTRLKDFEKAAEAGKELLEELS